MQSRKWSIWWRNLAPRSEKRRRGELRFQGINRWRRRWTDTWLCFVTTSRPDAFLPRVAPQRIHRQAGDPNEQVHLHPPDRDSRRHLCPAHHPPRPVTNLQLYIPKSSFCWPDMRIRIQLFPWLNFWILMQLPRIASTIQIFSRYADWRRNIHWLVNYLVCGYAANIHFEDQSSLWREPASDDEHWSKGKGFWRLFSYIYMDY